MMKKYFSTPIDTELLHRATGEIPYKLSNDYMFRAVMQEDQNALLSLIRAVIRPVSEEERGHFKIGALELLNPIMLGEEIQDKEFIMDNRLSLNDMYNNDVEMQVMRELFWPERSLSYLCRLFDDLNRGQTYGDLKRAAQISLMDYTLFADVQKLYSRYLLRDQEDGRIYSDKFSLYVVCLNQYQNATETDRVYRLDQWARLLKASTWEEVQMIVKENPDLEHVAAVFHQAASDEAIRLQCEARQRFLEEQAGRERRHRRIREQYEGAVKKMAELDEQLEKVEEQLAEKEGKLAEKEGQLAEKEGQLAEKDEQLAKKDAQIVELMQKLAAFENQSENKS